MGHVLLDSNLVIYGAKAGDQVVGPYVSQQQSIHLSEITLVEVLGFAQLSDAEEAAIKTIVESCLLLSVNRDVVDTAIQLRRRRRMTLGDAVIAATAIVHKLTLATRNVDDFSWIEELRVADPYASSMGEADR